MIWLVDPSHLSACHHSSVSWPQKRKERRCINAVKGPNSLRESQLLSLSLHMCGDVATQLVGPGTYLHKCPLCTWTSIGDLWIGIPLCHGYTAFDFMLHRVQMSLFCVFSEGLKMLVGALKSIFMMAILYEVHKFENWALDYMNNTSLYNNNTGTGDDTTTKC